MDFVERTKDVVAADLLTDKITNHEGCYANIANIATLEYANKKKKKRLHESIERGQSLP